MKISKTLIQKPDFLEINEYKISPPWETKGMWPGGWIWINEAGSVSKETPVVVAFKKKFLLKSKASFRIHVSADERYILYVDGARIGRGPERGDPNNWFYETYDLNLKRGKHHIVAVVWADRKEMAWAQTTVRNGFLLVSEDIRMHPEISTGVSIWECKYLKGIGFEPSVTVNTATGARQRIDGFSFPWGFEKGKEKGRRRDKKNAWMEAIRVEGAVDHSTYHIFSKTHILRPALLPEMYTKEYLSAKVVFAEVLPHAFDWNNFQNKKIELINNTVFANTSIDGMRIPEYSNIRILIDLNDYCCYYPKLVVTRGKGAEIRFGNCEALFDGENKKNRSEFDGKNFRSDYDYFTTDGGLERAFETFWWRAGRFIELCFKTQEEPLFIDKLLLTESRYPFFPQGTFESDNTFYNEILPICLRSVEMCSHETYMDCPYYEQLMYIGDTRIQVLLTYVYSNDTRLPKKAIEMFVEGMINHTGVPNCQYPCGGGKIIPSFSLWLIGIVHDYVLWNDDKEYLFEIMPALRSIIDHYLLEKGKLGLLKTPKGWNYVDWVDESNKDWFYGEPNDSGTGYLSVFNLQFVHVLELMTELENYCGESELARRALRYSEEIFEAVEDAFWDEEMQLYSDDLKHTYFCEQTQVVALLCKKLSNRKARIIEAEIEDGSKLTVKCSIYFSFYLFEAMKSRRNSNVIQTRLKQWGILKEFDFSTTPEVFESYTRSDCHAWGAHPAYHFLTTILGIRPADFAFERVTINPLLGDLKFANGTLIHPLGEIKVLIRVDEVSSEIFVNTELPEGLTGSFGMEGFECELPSGEFEFNASYALRE